MVNHDQVIVGNAWRSVIRSGKFFETACGIAASGLQLQTISAANAEALRSMARGV